MQTPFETFGGCSLNDAYYGIHTVCLTPESLYKCWSNTGKQTLADDRLGHKLARWQQTRVASGISSRMTAKVNADLHIDVNVKVNATTKSQLKSQLKSQPKSQRRPKLRCLVSIVWDPNYGYLRCSLQQSSAWLYRRFEAFNCFECEWPKNWMHTILPISLSNG